MNYLYIIRCEDNSLYTGITKDLHQRMDAHYNARKQGAKYTKSRKPKEISMVWEVNTWQNACRLEYFVKTLNKAQKEKLLQKPESLFSLFEGKSQKAEDVRIFCENSQNFPVFLKDFLSNCKKI